MGIKPNQVSFTPWISKFIYSIDSRKSKLKVPSNPVCVHVPWPVKPICEIRGNGEQGRHSQGKFTISRIGNTLGFGDYWSNDPSTY
jgi:hypothetical protein